MSYEVDEYFCGCCGCEIPYGSWCSRCVRHVGGDGPVWEWTYFAQHGIPCPFQVQP